MSYPVWGRSFFLLGFDAHESKQDVTNDVFLCKNSGLKDEMFMLRLIRLRMIV